MATRVASAAASGSVHNTSYQLAYGAAIQVGDLLVAPFRSGSGSDSCTGLTDSVNSGGWSRAAYKEGDGINVSGYIYYKIANAAGTPTVTFAFSDAPTCRASIHAYRGTFDPAPLGQTAFTKGTSTSPASGTITTAADETVVVGMVGCALDLGAGSFTNTSALTQQFQITGAAFTSLDALVASSGSYGASGTFDVSDRWTAIVAAFIETPSSFVPRGMLLGVG